MKQVLEKIKTVLIIIGLFVLGVASGAFAEYLLGKRIVHTDDDAAETAKRNKKDEIQNTPAEQLVTNADNAARLGTIKDDIKADFRQRIRNRFNENIQRLGSTGTAADNR